MRKVIAASCGVGALLLAVGAALGTAAVGWSFGDAVEAFVVSNVVIGVGFALCGTLIAWHRPSSSLGWMYAGGGACQALSAFAAPLSQLLADRAAPEWSVRLAETAFQWAWPINIALIPLSLLLLPDGRLPSPRWRPVMLLLAGTAPLFVLEVGLGPGGPAGLPGPFLTLPPSTYDALGWLWAVSEARWVLSVVVGLVCLALRYRRGDDVVRRQLLWLVAAAAVILVAVTPWALVSGTPLVVLFTLPLLPAAVATGVLRHQLLDIRVVLARGLAYALLSALVLAGYAALVVVLSGVTSALLVALLALPLRSRLQQAVDRLLYGERGNPVKVASLVGRSLGSGLPETLEEVRRALRLPYVGLVVDAVPLASAGKLTGPAAELPLADGTLLVGLRAGERRLAPADERVLALLSGPLSTAVRATGLLAELQVSRERLVMAQADERRRLRRELHDGLGPLLTGVALSADTAWNLAGDDSPTGLREKLTGLRADTRTAITEVRRIVDGLGSPALDELGLGEAVRIRAAQTTRRADGAPLRVTVDAGELPELSPAVSQAAYRILTEALTNVVRHSSGSSVQVRLGVGQGALRCEVVDDGVSRGPWRPGVGIAGMRERVAELGGACEAGPGPRGGTVRFCVPLESA
ncbi:sensor histidine kinase [Nocardioides islandensis]|uniref:sensor histidine kinase n=1 Tax=Nocardioides islandensis TaxID=433663 RepID=UPI002B27A089|nr:histidine kinase [Nocardioides islandensis]